MSHSSKGGKRRRGKRAREPGGDAAKAAAALADAQAHHQAGRLADAEQAYRQAIAAGESGAALYANMALALAGQGKTADATACLREAVAADPRFTDGHYNLGVLLQQAGRMEDARAAYARALEVDSGHFGAQVNMGVVLQEQGQLRDAAACYRRAAEIDPAFAAVHHNLGVVLQAMGEHAQAIEAFRQALNRKPDYVEALNGLAVSLQEQGDWDEAIRTFERAVEIDPQFAEALNNLATLYHRQGRLADAMAALGRALDIDPDYAEAHRNLSHVLLLQGRFAEGWQEFRWRWRCRDFPSDPRGFPQPHWAGEPLADKTILVWGEQGVGDEVQFAGLVGDLLDAGVRVILESDPRLVPLFQRSFPEAQCIPRKSPPNEALSDPDIDFQAPAGDLPRWLRPDPGSFPGRPSYLVADGERRDLLRRRYQDDGEALVVGIAWVSKNPEIGTKKSMSLMDWGPLAAIPGVRFVDLQYGDTAAARADFEAVTGTTILHDEAVDQMADLDAFAAQVAAMDLVVTVSNTTAHMAGALGVPTWVLLHTLPLPVWMLEAEESPWYPSVRLFRQSRADDWSDVVSRVKGALTARAKA